MILVSVLRDLSVIPSISSIWRKERQRATKCFGQFPEQVRVSSRQRVLMFEDPPFSGEILIPDLLR